MKDDAVSPVIGVMIMLTVTIVIAAVLAAFAGGFADTNLAAPSADLTAEFTGSGDHIRLCLLHSGGDALNPADIRVSAYVRTSDSSGSPLRIAELTAESLWKAGDSILVTEKDTQKLLGLSAEEAKDTASAATPVEISIHHIPSSEIMARCVILLEDA